MGETLGRALRRGRRNHATGAKGTPLDFVAFHAKGSPTVVDGHVRMGILQRMVFDGEQLTGLLEPLGLAWKARRLAELALMEDLVPLLKKRAAGRDISGLSAYEQ